MTHNKEPIGSVRIRTRHKRGGERRAWIKVDEPNVWKLRAHVVWERERGPVPPGKGVHHVDRNKLNDVIENLELVSKAEHLAEHRSEFDSKRIASSVAARRRLRWSTKSTTKRTGRPPRYTDERLAAALAELKAGARVVDVIAKHGISRSSLHRWRAK